ncbi:MAG: histidine phosphatase family protein [Eubacteriales bacterium]|nr:histidine phosphatase family protein [Eubacteriales bacterium]
MCKIVLIRHSITAGNEKKRYIGRTDEPLCEAGRELLKGKTYPDVQRLYVSPMLRCRQTASLIYPGQAMQVIEDFRECDFGEFENKNYLELADNLHYQQWIDSNGMLPFPHGESREGFQKRSTSAFVQMVESCLEDDISSAAAVVHGGTIMSVLEACASEKKEYYGWHVGNGGGYVLQIDENQWRQGIHLVQVIEQLS